MTTRDDRDRAADDARLVRRIADLYAPPPPSAASRARFDARLAERLEARAGWRGALGLPVAAGALLALALLWVPTREPAVRPIPGAGGGEVILALALAPAGEPDADLPEDYQAISALLAE